MLDFLFPKEGIINRRIPGAPAPLKVPLYMAKLWSESPTALAQEHPHKKTPQIRCVFCLWQQITHKIFTLWGWITARALAWFSFQDARATKKHPAIAGMFLFLVALVGLEPTLLAELDFESSASTNSATGPELQMQY